MFTPKSNIEVVVREKRTAAAKVRLFARVKKNTLAKLNLSLSDLDGRYASSNAYKNPKPSQNWKVVKKGETLEYDVLEVWLKVGIVKAPINAEGDKEVRLTPENAKAYLTEMRDWVQSLEENDDASEEFQKLAIEASFPKSKPKGEGMNDWKYDKDSGQYIAIFNPNK